MISMEPLRKRSRWIKWMPCHEYSQSWPVNLSKWLETDGCEGDETPSSAINHHGPQGVISAQSTGVAIACFRFQASMQSIAVSLL